MIERPTYSDTKKHHADNCTCFMCCKWLREQRQLLLDSLPSPFILKMWLIDFESYDHRHKIAKAALSVLGESVDVGPQRVD